jgi:hypothetical protein
VKARPGVGIPWNYEGGGLWKAECVCTIEYVREPTTDDRVRLDPYDPATARHFGQCEYVGETDPAVIKILLKVTDKGDHDWVECGSCEAGWQVVHYAESVG